MKKTAYRHPPRPPRRGAEGQRERRGREKAARLLLGAYLDFARAESASLAKASAKLGVPPSSLAAWSRLSEEDHLDPKPLGPAARRCDRSTRRQVLELLAARGPSVGLPTLQASFPEVARLELKDLLARFRRARVRGKTTTVQELRWTEPGSVWAIDYTDPPCQVDGVFPSILSVRDLASQRQLLALPARETTALTTTNALLALFAEHGPPLVMKSDNGSHFTALDVEAALGRAGVLHLLSPPYTPAYNGACEAGIGALKTRAHHEAARHGRPWEWTCDDVEAARVSINETGRPWGANGPTPDEVWRARRPLGADLRHALADTVARVEPELRRLERDLAGRELDERELASVRREAISRALVAHGLLVVRRREIRLPLSAHLRTKDR